jgi:Arc/MetJ family transcription regulator
MRTNIVLNDALVEEALALSHLKTKRELIEAALTEFVAHRKRLNLRALKGSGGIRDDYDYKQLRAGKDQD